MITCLRALNHNSFLGSYRPLKYAITTLSEQAIKERCQFFIYQTFESRLKREMINVSKKYPKKESSTIEVLLEEREIVKDSLFNVYKDASDL